MDVASRVVAVPMAVLALAVFSAAGSAGSARADSPPTQGVTTLAVGPNGQPINGYEKAPALGNLTNVRECTTQSPSGGATNAQYFSPNRGRSSTCLPATP